MQVSPGPASSQESRERTGPAPSRDGKEKSQEGRPKPFTSTGAVTGVLINTQQCSSQKQSQRTKCGFYFQPHQRVEDYHSFTFSQRYCMLIHVYVHV